MKILLILLVLVSQSNIYAAEVDTFSIDPNEPFNNSKEAMNKKARSLIHDAIEYANKTNKGCNKASKRFERKLKSNFEKYLKFLHKDESIERKRVDFLDSIYASSFLYPLFLVNPILKLGYDVMSPVIRYDDLYIGIDKFEHFFRMGKLFYFNTYTLNLSPKISLAESHATEWTLFGGIGTGIVSYSDHSTNFNGMRFFAHFFNESEDVLGEEYAVEPYVSCVDEKLRVVREFNWDTYIDKSWDERMNCFKVANPLQKKSLKNAIKKREERFNTKLACPIISAVEQEALKQKYGQYSKDLLNFEF